MKVKSIKVNFILNVLRLFLGAFFLLITIPYTTRTLGSEALGKVEYINSIITYFTLFTALGIPSYGIRETARIRGDEKERTKLVVELGTILIITTVVGYIILYFFIIYFKNIQNLKILMLIMSTGIIFNNIGFEWFYQGIENQIYITIRFIMVKVLTLILLFLLIKDPSDYLKYGAILVLMTRGANILNLFNIKNYISLKTVKLKNLEIKKHLKPIFTIFAATLSVSIYLQLDTIMLGNIDDKFVAYYSVPNKLIGLVLVVVTALGSVLLPRITNCLRNNDIENYKKYIDYSLKYILLISIPSVIGIVILSNNIILVMAGNEFIESIMTLKILSVIIFIVGIAYFLGFQILYPHGLEKYYTYSVTIAAAINFVFNYLMIPKYYQNGAAIGTIIAELTGVIIMLYFSKKYLKEIEFYSLKNLKYLFSGIIMGIVVYIIKTLKLDNLITLLLSVSIGSIVYFIILIVLKEEITINGLVIIKNKIYKKERK
ncbi:flippase [Fusobacterium varium]